MLSHLGPISDLSALPLWLILYYHQYSIIITELLLLLLLPYYYYYSQNLRLSRNAIMGLTSTMQSIISTVRRTVHLNCRLLHFPDIVNWL